MNLPKINIEIPKVELPKIEVVKPPENGGNSKDNALTKSIKKVIRDSGKTLWSYSRLSTFHNCKYEYYLGYVEEWIDEKGRKRNGKRGNDNVYSVLGEIVHLCLEGFLKGEYTREQMIQKFELIYADTKVPKMGKTMVLNFPSEKIEKNYIECVRIFLKNYIPPKADVTRLEDFLWELFNNGKVAMQGYADCILGYTDENGNPYAIIDDFKTSSKFKQEDMLDKGRQLVMYAYMYTKRTGIPVKTVRWNMIKYCKVNFPTVLADLKKKSATELKEFLASKGVTEKLKKDEAISEALKHDLKGFVDYREDSYIYQKNELYTKTHKELDKLFKALGYDDEFINRNLSILERENSFNQLEDEFKQVLDKFKFTSEDWYNEYHITQEIIDEMENWIISTTTTLDKIPKQLNENEIDFYYPPVESDISKNPFYCVNLCGHAKEINGSECKCKHYKKYIENNFK